MSFRRAGALAGWLLAAVAPATVRAQADSAVTTAQLIAGQDLIYHGRFSAAVLYFSRLAADHPRHPAAPALEASAMIWWGQAQNQEAFDADSIDALLGLAIDRAGAGVDSAAGDSARVEQLYWLGTALEYRARQAEARGNYWRAWRDARAMQHAMQRALAIDSTCIDCQLPLGLYEYGLARVGGFTKLVVRILGLSGGDAQRGLGRLRLASDSGTLTTVDAQWAYANLLERESASDRSRHEEALRIVGTLADRYPENPVFRRFLEPAQAATP